MAVTIGSFIVLIIVGLAFLPPLLLSYTERQVVPDKDYAYATAVDKYRATLAQIVGGLVVLAGLYYTAKNVLATEQSGLTKTFSDAIGQLGAVDANGKPNIAIRLGGIYALERIARFLPQDSHVIGSILASYVREESVRRRPETETADRLNVSDIEAAMIVLSLIVRAKALPHGQKLKIDKAFLQHLTLNDKKFNRFLFLHCDLKGSHFEHSHCEDANFESCDADDCDFSNALLTRAEFNNINSHINCISLRAINLRVTGCDLTNSDFSDARLDRSLFSNSNLTGCIFIGASLANVIISDSILTGARFDGADLMGAHLNGASGLTDEQLKSAKVRPSDDGLPPYLRKGEQS